jgi:hypothetical protein
MDRRSLAAPQRLQRKHNLSGLPPQHVFVAAEAIQGARGQICQAQVAVDDILFQVVAELVSLRGVGILYGSQEKSLALRDICGATEVLACKPMFGLARVLGHRFKKSSLDCGRAAKPPQDARQSKHSALAVGWREQSRLLDFIEAKRRWPGIRLRKRPRAKPPRINDGPTNQCRCVR